MHWGRKVVIVLGVVFLFLGVFLLKKGNHQRAEIKSWATSATTDFNLNLSRPGQYVVPFRQTSRHALGVLWFVTGLTNSQAEIEELKGTVVIRDSSKTETIRQEFTGKSLGWGCVAKDTLVPALYLEQFPPGGYELELTISEGGSGFTTTNHSVQGRYMWCGMEEVPAIIVVIEGWMLLFLATICLVMTFRYLMRRRQAI
jgi:hypothetical protein